MNCLSCFSRLAAETVRFASAEMKNHPTVALTPVELDANAFKLIGSLMQGYSPVIEAAVRVKGALIEHASTEMKEKRELALLALQSYGYALGFLPITFQNDPEMVETAITQNGDAIKYSSHAIKANPETSLLALQSNTSAYKHIDPSLKSSIEFNCHAHFLAPGIYSELSHDQKLAASQFSESKQLRFTWIQACVSTSAAFSSLDIDS